MVVDTSKLNPAFVLAIRGDGTPRAVQARLAGFSHYNNLSSLLTAERVPRTAKTVARLVRLALLVGHPVDQIFQSDVRDDVDRTQAHEYAEARA